MQQNEISDIEKHSFDAMTSLARLDLSMNKIRKIKNATFGSLAKLELLKLDNNEIKQIEIHSFYGMNNLRELALSPNVIEVIPNELFKNMTKMTHLNITRNRLSKLQPYSFGDLPFVQWLDLSHNFLDGLDANLFNELASLRQLYLSFNYFKILANTYFSAGLGSLTHLHLDNNELRTIEAFAFKNLFGLIELHLEFNSISKLESNAFFNLSNLARLYLGANRVTSLDAIHASLSALTRLESLDLQWNQIESLQADAFSFSTKLKSLMLNNNKIKSLSNLTFVNLERLVFSQNKLDMFDLSSLNAANVTHLDLSFNFLTNSASFPRRFLKLESLRLRNVTFLQSTLSFDLFMNERIQILDLSCNDLSDSHLAMLTNLRRVTSLELRHVGLRNLTQIQLPKFSYLKYLDLSFNRLTYVDYDLIAHLDTLEYLDLSNNLISYISPETVTVYTFMLVLNKINPLRYLNLENNRLEYFQNTFNNYFNLATLRMANNYLSEVPLFAMYLMGTDGLSSNDAFYFNNNVFTTIKAFAACLDGLRVVNFDFNRISLIGENAFLNLKHLTHLSIANNCLSRVSKRDYLYLYSLSYLNLSSNRVAIIDVDSFVNLNKLVSLDLSFNELHAIEINMFSGLNNLNDLHLLSEHFLVLYKSSFNYLTSIANIYLNASLVIANKCLFMNTLERTVQRNVGGKYLFYKSLNLITEANELNSCALTFHFLQFRIHLNLKTDNENEVYFRKCGDSLISTNNSYLNHYFACY